MAKLGQRRGPQPQLHRLAFGDIRGIHQQQASQHALDVFVNQHVRRIQQHGALNPRGTQMQMANRAIV